MRSDEKRRQETIERILAYRKSGGGFRPGIFAAEACQVCGTVKAFDGFIPALSLHSGSDGAFVCGTCRRAELAGTLHEQGHRYCEICCRPFPSAELTRDGHRWVCKPCKDEVETEYPGISVTEYVRDLVARRYIEMKCPDDEALAAFEADVRTIARDLKKIGHSEQEE